MSETAGVAPLLDPEHPWPGLSSFHEEDAGYFRGRAQEIETVHRLVRREALTVLFGRAGLGKTSLLRAGVFPLLRGEQFLPVYLRLDYQSSASLVRQVRDGVEAAARAAGLRVSSERGETLWEWFHRIGAELWDVRHRIVTPAIVIDQFEEIFTKGQDRSGEIAELVEQIADVVERRVPDSVREALQAGRGDAAAFDFERLGARIVLSLREDFMPQLESLRPRLRGILDKRIRLEPMIGVAALEVLDAGRLLLAEGVAEAIVRFVADDAGGTPLPSLTVEPALLSVVCDELNEKRLARHEPLITRDLLSGSQDSILSDFYERSVGDLGPAVRRFVEEALLTTDGYRDSVALGRAFEGGGVTPEAIAALVDRRVVRIERAGQVSRVELTHDLLTDVVRQSRDARRQADAAAALRQAKRQLRRARSLAALFVVLFLVAAGAVLFAFGQKKAAQSALRFAREMNIKLGDAYRAAAESDASAATARLQAISQQAKDQRDRADLEARQTSRWSATFAASRLHDDSAADALASLAYALRRDPDNAWARMMAFNLLLTHGWPRAEKVVRIGERVPVPLATSSDGKRFIVAGPKVADVFDAASKRVLCQARTKGFVGSVAISGDGQRFAVGDYRGALLFGDMAKCRMQSIESGHDSGVTSLAFSPDGKWLASGGGDRAVQVWNAAEHTPVRDPFELDHGQVYDLRFSPKGTFLAAAAGDASMYDLLTGGPAPSGVTLWHTGDWTQSGISDTGDGTTSIAFSADESRFVTASRHGIVQEWSVDERKPIGPARRNTARADAALSVKLDGVEYHPRGQSILASSAGGTSLWDMTHAEENDPESPTATIPMPVKAYAHFSADGARVLTASDDGVVRVWNGDGQPLTEPARWLSQMTDARFVNGGAELAAAYDDGKLIFWRVDRPVDGEVPLQELPTSLLTTPDRHYGVFYAKNGRLTVTDLTGGKTVRAVWLNTEQGCKSVLDLSPDASFVICDTGVYSHERRVLRTDINSQYDYPYSDWRHDADDRDGSAAAATVKKLRDLTGWWWSFTPDPDLIVERRGNDVYVRDRRRQWSEVARLRDAGEVVGFDRLGKRVLTKSGSPLRPFDSSVPDTNVLHVWELPSGRPVATTRTEKVELSELDPAGARLVYVTSNDATVLDLATGRKVKLRHSGSIKHASFSGDGRTIVTASDDHTARVWRADDGVPVSVPLRHAGPVIYAALSPDGRFVATVEGAGKGAFDDGPVRVWDVDTGLILRHLAPGPGRNGVARPDHSRPVFGASGRLLAFDGAVVRLLDFRAGTKDDAALLAELAEAVAGRRVAEEGVIVDTPNGIEALRKVADSASGNGDAAKLARWFAADVRSRTASPFSANR